jgi:hypothetical protein
MRYLYGVKKDGVRRLVATFGSEQQLQAYVRWATLEKTGERAGKFEQGSALASCQSWEQSTQPLTEDDPTADRGRRDGGSPQSNPEYVVTGACCDRDRMRVLPKAPV